MRMRQPKKESRRPSHLVTDVTRTHKHADAANGARAIMHTDGFAGIYRRLISSLIVSNCIARYRKKGVLVSAPHRRRGVTFIATF